MRWFVMLVVLLISCGGKKDAEAPTCEQVTDHILSVTKQQLEGHENTNIVGQRKAMVEQCEKRNMAVEVRTCLMGAKTIAEISVCRGRGKPGVIERQRRPRPGSAGSAQGSGSGTTGSATRSGSGTGSGSGSAR